MDDVPKAESVSDDIETPDLTIEPLEDETELPLQRQLEIEEERLTKGRETAARKSSSRSDDTENDEEVQGDLSKRERDLAELVDMRAQLREAREAVEHFRRLAEEKQRREEETPYEVGELDPTVDVIRPTLNRMGQEARSEVRQLEQKVLQMIERNNQRQDELEAEAVSARMRVSQEEEDLIIAWAQKEGRSYNNKKELVKLIEDYRAAQELRELRALRNRKPDRKAETSAVSRSRPSARSEDKDDDEGGDSFDRSWRKAVRTVMSDLRAGRSLN